MKDGKQKGSLSERLYSWSKETFCHTSDKKLNEMFEALEVSDSNRPAARSAIRKEEEQSYKRNLLVAFYLAIGTLVVFLMYAMFDVDSQIAYITILVLFFYALANVMVSGKCYLPFILFPLPGLLLYWTIQGVV